MTKRGSAHGCPSTHSPAASSFKPPGIADDERVDLRQVDDPLLAQLGEVAAHRLDGEAEEVGDIGAGEFQLDPV